MLTRGSQILTWDAENRLTAVTEGSTTTQFIYDGDGNRVKKIEGGQTILYVNQYYEVNLTTSNITSYYYLGGRLIAQSENGTLSYIHQDSLSSTSLMTDSLGTQVGSTVKYLPFGEAKSTVTVPTDKLFTGQRLDQTGLYYYNARYYDPTIGRFISPDTIIPNHTNPQSFNRYSYCLNNPLKYTDPSGHWPNFKSMWGSIRGAASEAWGKVSDGWDSISDKAEAAWDWVCEKFDKTTVSLSVNGNIYGGYGVSGGVGFAWDFHGGTALIGTVSTGYFGGIGLNAGVQGQVTNAGDVLDLAGTTQSYGGSVTLGPSTPVTLGTINIGANVGTEAVIGDDYNGWNLNYGGGISVLPVEGHSTTDTTYILHYFNIIHSYTGPTYQSNPVISQTLLSYANSSQGQINPDASAYLNLLLGTL